MLRITIDLLPQGDETHKRTLVTGTIANTGTGTMHRGNYRVDLRGVRGRKWKHTEIRGFPRKYLLVWDLLYRALDQLVGERNHADERKRGSCATYQRPVVANQRQTP